MKYYKHKTIDQVLIVDDLQTIAYFSDRPNIKYPLGFPIFTNLFKDHYREATEEEVFLDIL